MKKTLKKSSFHKSFKKRLRILKKVSFIYYAWIFYPQKSFELMIFPSYLNSHCFENSQFFENSHFFKIHILFKIHIFFKNSHIFSKIHIFFQKFTFFSEVHFFSKLSYFKIIFLFKISIFSILQNETFLLLSDF